MKLRVKAYLKTGKGLIEKHYSRDQIVDALEEYILECFGGHEFVPMEEFRTYIEENFGKTYHLLDDFELDEDLWNRALKQLEAKHQVVELDALKQVASYRSKNVQNRTN